MSFGLELASVALAAFAHVPSPSEASVHASAPAVPAQGTPSEAEVADLARALLREAATGQRKAVDARVDIPELVARALRPLQIDGAELTDAVARMSSVLERRGIFGAAFAEVGPRGTDGLSLVRVATLESDRLLVFRIIRKQGDFNFVELRAGRAPNGRVCVVDKRDLGSGNWTSEELRRAYLAELATRHPERIPALPAEHRALAEHAADVARLSALVGEQKNAEAVELYKSLPEALRTTRMLLLPMLRCAREVAPDVFEQAARDLRTRYPGDGSGALITLTDDLSRGDYDDALVRLDEIAAAVGDDAWLEVCRSTVFEKKNDLDAARAALQRAIEREPGLKRAYDARLEFALRHAEHELVFETLKGLDTHFPMKWAGLMESKPYEAFAASPWHAKWIEYLKAKPR